MSESTCAPPVALTVAGSDNSAGAGLQADLKTFGALGVYGLSAVTCVVAEVPGKVSAIHPVPPDVVREQVRLCFEAYPVAAMKTGMLYSREIMEAVCEVLEGMERPFLVVDPVMVATSGDALLRDEAVEVYRERVFALADMVTPNLDEVRVLLGREVASVEGMRDAARELHERHGCGVLVKGGHLRERMAVDVFVWKGEVTELEAPFVRGVSTHGTGCTFAAAMAAGVARGLSVPDAVREAKDFVSAAIGSFLRWERPGGRVTDALNHMTACRSPGAG